MAKNILFIVGIFIVIFLVGYVNMTERQKSDVVPEPIKEFIDTTIKSFGGGGGSSQETKAIPPINKIRAMYGYSSTPKPIIDKAVTNGINTLIVKYGVDNPDEEILTLANYNKDMSFIPAINFNYVSSVKSVYYNEDSKTIVEGVATPVLNRAYWGKLTSKVKSLAQLNVKGVFIDFETYFDYPSAPFVYSYNGSYDTETFGEFIVANNLQSANPPISDSEKLNRYNWIKTNNLEDEYTAFVKAKAIELSRSFEQEVHSVNPNFIIGVYPSPTWSSRNRYTFPLFFDFYNGFGKVALFATDTYGYGNNLGNLPVELNGDVFIRRDNNEQYNLDYISGALLRYYSPEEISLITPLNKNTDGFWIFSTSLLTSGCSSLTLDGTSTNYYRLPTNCKTDLNSPGCCINQWSVSNAYWIANCCPSYDSTINEYWTAIASI